MRKIVALLSMVAVVIGFIVAMALPAQAVTCNSYYVSINHTFVTEGADDDTNGNFVWRYCTVVGGEDYIEITSVGGNYDMNNGINCGAGPSMTGFTVELNVPGDDIAVTVPCREDGTHGQTFDIPNRRWSAPVNCSYAAPHNCLITVNYSMTHRIRWDFGIADQVWTSNTRTLG